MDIIKPSENLATRISNLGEQFRFNLLMGELAYSTFDDFFELANIIQASVDYWEAEGRSGEQIAELLQQDKQVQQAVEQVFERMVITAEQYGYLTDEPRETALEYCRAAGKALKDLEVICQDLGLENLFHILLFYYGSGAQNYLRFSEQLERVYENHYTAPVDNLVSDGKRLRRGASIQPPVPKKFNDLEETTIVSPPESLEKSVPPMPPAPELLEPSAAQSAEHTEIGISSMRSSRPPVEGHSLESGLNASANSPEGGQAESLAESTQNEPIGPKQESLASYPEIEVYVSQKQYGPRAMALTEPDSFPAVKAGKSVPQLRVRQVVFDPIPPTEDLVLPSSYSPETTSQAPRRSKIIREDQAIERDRVETPEQVRSRTRSGLWKWATAAAAAAGLAGLLGGFFSGGEDRSDGADQGTAAASVGSGGIEEKIATRSPAATDRQNETSAEKQPEKGVYRFNVSHQAFGDYLCYMKEATRLVSVMKAAASQTRVHFFADFGEFEAAKSRYVHVLTGSETEAQQRIVITKAFLDLAIQKSADNTWLTGYFKKQRMELEHYEKNGFWTHKGKSIGADRLFEAVQIPEKLTTDPNVIGYAPDVNPSTNPALLKIKAGAPTFYRILQDVGASMQSATAPDRLSPYNDFQSIKDETCRQVLEAGRASNDRDTRAGISYMHRHWCADECVPHNPLNQVLRAPAIAVRTEVPAAPAVPPATTTTPVRANPPEKVHQSPPASTHSLLEQRSPWADQPPATVQPKKGVFSRAMASVKSFLGIGKKTERTSREMEVTQGIAAPACPVENAPEFSKKDIPMYTWKEILKQYFWG